MDLIKLKSSLDGIKVDAQEILIDLHSDDIVKDFFNLHMIDSMDEKSKMESIEAKKQMISMVGVEFKDDIITMKKNCAELIELVEELHEDIKDK